MPPHLPTRPYDPLPAKTFHTTHPLWRRLTTMVLLPLLWGTTPTPVAASAILATHPQASAPSTLPSRDQEMPIPANGNCLYNSLVMGYLVPVTEDEKLFNRQLAMLVGEKAIMPAQAIQNNQDNANNDEQKVDNDSLWNPSTLRQTLLQLRRAGLVYALQQDPFPTLVHNMKKHMHIGHGLWGGANEIKTIAQQLQVTIQEYTPHPKDHTKLVALDTTRPQGVKAPLTLRIVKDKATPEETNNPYDDLNLRKAKVLSIQDDQHRQHYRALLDVVPDFLWGNNNLIPDFIATKDLIPPNQQGTKPPQKYHAKPIPLGHVSYTHWGQNKRIVYTPSLSGKQGHEDNVNGKDDRKEIKSLPLKLKAHSSPVDVTAYIVRLHADYGLIGDEQVKVESDGTATIMMIQQGIIYLLTCAHNVVKYQYDPFGDAKTYRAKNVSFFHQGKEYVCAYYYVHPSYVMGEGTDVALVVSHRGYALEKFPTSIFPDVVPMPEGKYVGYVMGFPGEKEKKGKLYGMQGHVEVKQGVVMYKDIDTSKGQSGSPIWALMKGVYKVIGVHTTGYFAYNYGPLLTPKVIDWEKVCWCQTEETYAKHSKVLSRKECNMTEVVQEGTFDVGMISATKATPFNWAAYKGNIAVLKILKNKGANLLATDQYGYNALHIAVVAVPEGKGIVWLLENTGLSIEAKGQYQMTPFLFAAYKGHIAALKILKNKGANLLATNQYGNNALHIAVVAVPEGKGIVWLLENTGLSINAKGQYQMTPFCMAAHEGHLAALKILKNKGANLLATNQYGNNALHLAALHAPEGKGIVWLLENTGLSINAKGEYQKTPFCMAAHEGHLAALKILKNKGANLLATDQYGNNALHLAALHAPEGKGIVWLLENTGLSVNAKGQYQTTPFCMAAQKGHLAALKILKSKGANVNAKNQYGNNALHLAAMDAPEAKGIVWLLQNTGLSIEAKGQDQATPFLCAAQKGNLAALKILKNKGANLLATNQDGNNALHLAALFAPEGKGIVWLLQNTGLSINAKGQYQMTPFCMAAQNGNLAALKILKNKGANLLATNQDGNNALHFAAMFAPEGKGIVWLLENTGLSINAKGQYQRTPFLFAAQNGNVAVLKILKSKGANLLATNQYGNNALHLAAMFAPEGKGIVWLLQNTELSINAKGSYQKTPFCMAAQEGNVAALKILKNKGANLLATNQKGNNALHLAAMFAPEGKGIVWLLENTGLSIEAKGYQKMTPFCMAAAKGHLPALKILKNKGANLLATDQYGNNALHYAAGVAPEGKGIAWLLENTELSIEAKGYQKRTPFCMAAKKGNIPALKILKNKGANLLATDQYGHNALHLAAMFAPEGKGIVWLLENTGLSINAKGQDQMTPFCMAAQKGNVPALKILKNKGANVHATDEDGYNALHYAAWAAPEGKGIVWLLENTELSIDAKGQYQTTPFCMAAQKGHLAALKILKNKGANVHATDEHGYNALHLAAFYAPEGKGIVWLLENTGLSINAKGPYQMTPFCMAAENGHLAALKILKNKGANLLATNQYGYNALHLAAMFAPEGKGIVWLLENTKLSIDTKGHEKKTPFLIAAVNGHLAALKILKSKGANLLATDEDGCNALWYTNKYSNSPHTIQWLKNACGLKDETCILM